MDDKMTPDRLRELGGETAKQYPPTGRGKGRGDAAAVQRALRQIEGELARSPQQRSGRREWLEDNGYLLRELAPEAARALADARRVPVRGDRTAMLHAMERLAEAVDGAVGETALREFLTGYAAVRAPEEGELALLIPALRGALLIALAEDRSDPEGRRAGALVSAIRWLASFDAEPLTESVSAVERVLRRDPAGVYPLLDGESRRRCRADTARLARVRGTGEEETASALLREAGERGCHVGDLLPRRRSSLWRYPVAPTVAAAVLTAAFGWATGSMAGAAALLLPLWALTLRVWAGCVTRRTPPCRLPRLELREGVPFSLRTVCVISALVPGEQTARELLRRLEEYRHLSRDAGPNLSFGLLADLPEADFAQRPEDAPILRALREGVDGLNARYGGGFALFLRPRTLSPGERRHMGRERKRGAIQGLMRLLRGLGTEVYCAAGSLPEDVRYLITLDADTRLTSGSALAMIGAAAHPAHRPAIRDGRVVSGYGVLQPRVSVELEAACATDFSRIQAGRGGVDPYGSLSSEVYQDLFGAGSFSGKGILDVDAYLAVLDGAFPTGRILSHDLLEGEYLRCGFLSDVEVTDGWPGNVLSWLGRLHRWIRGDWQTAPWLCARVPSRDGSTRINPLTTLGKWKILDNLRRSLTPVWTLGAILAGLLLPEPGLWWAAGAAVLIRGTEGAAPGSRRPHYRAGALPDGAAGVMRGLVGLLLLPAEAWTCLSGAVTAVWRMAVSHRGLLEWVTAAELEKHRAKDGPCRYYRRLWPCPAAGLACALGGPLAWAAGIVWLLAPLCALSLRRQRRPLRRLREGDRLWLTREAGKIWQYFHAYLTAADHYLPPDNWQERPGGILARRTSPTNIGLALLACAAALDLGAAPAQEALSSAEALLDTLGRMEKRNGHLYNWYDTATLRPLTPRWVSTVDSGNLAACLTATEAWLRELRETRLADTAARLRDAMGFAWLYDRRKELFYIGWDCQKNEPAQGWYDLLSSEARLTSYLAVARGDVPARHWRRLGRPSVTAAGCCGTASWTGTMFEYLMPELLLPTYPGSLGAENRELCLCAQKRRGPGVWGISESAYYAFDQALSYRYKANGVEALALKRGMDADLVIAPYASFLALGTDPVGAVKNLRKLARLGAAGRYGFYEAVDFTPSRTGDRPYQVVRTWMSHHLGMSLAAADNALRDGVLIRRFLSSPAMGAYRELLQEKPPARAVPLRRPAVPAPQSLPRVRELAWERRCAPAPLAPRCTLLSNGAYTLLLDDTGRSGALWRGRMVYVWDREPLGVNPGIRAVLCCGGETISLTPLEEGQAHFTGSVGTVSADCGGIHASAAAWVAEGEAGELREVTVRAGSGALRGTLCMWLEPALLEEREYRSHPAFSRLRLEFAPVRGGITVTRRSAGDGGEGSLCVLCDGEAVFDIAAHRNGDGAARTRGGAPEPRLTASVPIFAEAGGVSRTRLCLAVGETPRAAEETARRILRDGEPTAFPEREARRLGMDAPELGEAMEALSALLLSPPPAYEAAAERAPRALWSLGVSGDLPVLCALIPSPAELGEARRLLRRHALYEACGIRTDLILLAADSGDYRSPVTAEVLRTLRELGREALLGAYGGIHPADAASPGAAAARRFLPRTEKTQPLAPERVPRLTGTENAPPVWEWLTDGSFAFLLRGQLPEAAWSIPLTNGDFGYLAADTGLGHLWVANAREGQITPWVNDPVGETGPETLTLRTEAGEVSLFAARDGFPCRVTFSFGAAVWEKRMGSIRSRVTAFVPPDAWARVLRVELSGVPAGAELRYCARLALGSREDAASVVTIARQDGGEAFSLGERFGDRRVRFAASVPPLRQAGDRLLWLAGESGGFGAGGDPCMGLVFPAASLTLTVGCAPEETHGALLAAPEESLRRTREHWAAITGAFCAHTPSRALDHWLNGWSLYQILASRLLGRASVYQCGGAYGFRDQLQDVCALTPFRSQDTAAQLLRAAARQFPEGDALHWWHETAQGPRGVRTRISDDLLWLPETLWEYERVTGDRALRHTRVAYLAGEPLADGERERYTLWSPGGEGTLLEHALAACREVLRRGCGAHGLLRMGAGDWNDGMNAVNGESVWLTWFASLVFAHAAALTETPGEDDFWRDASRRLLAAGESAWDGDRYLRGYYADGSPLGAAGETECAIDSVAQSFAVFAGADAQRTDAALSTALKLLWDREHRVVRLLVPPFGDGVQRPGYIRAYCPGYRENGGQYTHGAVWLALALLRRDRVDEAWALLRDLLPAGRDPRRYRAEPYVLAADVSADPYAPGRGGWSWYTGAAGWLLRASLALMGIRVEAGRPVVRPHLPAQWRGCDAVLRLDGREYRIRIRKGDISQ